MAVIREEYYEKISEYLAQNSLITVHECMHRTGLGLNRAKKALFGYIQKEEEGNCIPFSIIYLLKYLDKDRDSYCYKIGTMEQLESSEVKPEDISNASVYAISMKPLGQDCIEAEKLFTQHYKNKLIDYLNDDTLKKRKTLVSKDRRMSKYSIIHRKYTINANKAETQKQMVSRTATKSAAKGKVVKSDISHVKPPFNPYQQGYYKWNTFGNKVKDVQKDYDRRSFGSTSSGGTVSVKKCRTKKRNKKAIDKDNNITHGAEEAFRDDPEDYNLDIPEIPEEEESYADNQIDHLIDGFGDDANEMKNPFQKAKETAQAMKNKIKNEIEECFDNEELFRRQKESKKSLQLQGGRANQQATFASTYVQKKTIKTRVHNLTSKRKCSNKRKKQDTSSGMVLNNGQIKLTTFVKSKNNIKR